MGGAIQYYNGRNWQEFEITEDDITITGWQGSVGANFFNCVKDSKDTIYILCGFNSGTDISSFEVAIIAIDKDGTKRVTKFSDASYSCSLRGGITTMQIDRSEQYIFVNLFRSIDGSSNGYVNLIKFPTNFQHGVDIPFPHTEYYYREYNANFKFAIYQDRYIWIASGNTVKIYDYTTKAELASKSLIADWQGTKSICCQNNNICYITGRSTNLGEQIQMFSFNDNPPNIIATQYNTPDMGSYAKQLLLDKYNDLIILTNSETASTLLKYTTAGVQIGTTLDLGDAFYNLNTDKDGNYYYSTYYGTYKIAANTAQGQAFTGTGSKIRDKGMETYDNNISGYNPAVFG